jgi:hypothetical protein
VLRTAVSFDPLYTVRLPHGPDLVVFTSPVTRPTSDTIRLPSRARPRLYPCPAQADSDPVDDFHAPRS